MQRCLRARRIVTLQPGRPDIDNAALVYDTESGRILEIEPARQILRAFSGPVQELGDVTLAPGLINAHTHLELSHLRGRLPEGQGFARWVAALIALPLDDLDAISLTSAIDALVACGTVAVGDITSRNSALVAQALLHRNLDFLLFAEFIGFGRPGGPQPGFTPDSEPPWPPALRALPPQILAASATPYGHALYSTHPETLRSCKAWTNARGLPFTLHLAEHEGEVELLATGTGEFADLLRRRLLPDWFRPPGLSPVAYAEHLGLLDAATLAVHCVHLEPQDIALLAGRDVTVCLCPRSNASIGAGRAPVERLRAAGVRLCLGTDSLASNADLNLWNELRFFLENSSVPCTLVEALAMLTATPARAMGMQHRLGTLEPGRLARYSIVPEDLATL